MKIERFEKINRYKSFLDFSWGRFFQNNNLQKANIFYGENGSGKTSVCNILKSLSRYEDFSEYFPEDASVRTDKAKHRCSDGSWDKKIDEDSILFFDKRFVDKNIHVGSQRGSQQEEQEQQSGKLIIEFDAKAISLRGKQEKLRNERKEAAETQGVFEEDNKESLDFRLDDGEEKLFKEHKDKTDQGLREHRRGLEQDKKNSETKLEKDQNNKKKVDKIQANVSTFDTDNPSIQDIQISDLERCQSLLSFDVKKKARIETDQILINKLKQHKDFFEEGIKIRQSDPDRCPFCQSIEVEGNIANVTEVYNNIYDNVYNRQLSKFRDHKNELLDELRAVLDAVNNFQGDSIFPKLRRLDKEYDIRDIYSPEEESSLKKPSTKQVQSLESRIRGLEKPSGEKITKLHNLATKEVDGINQFFTSIRTLLGKKNAIIEQFRRDNTDQKIRDRIVKSKERLGLIKQEIGFIDQGLLGRQRQKLEKMKQLNSLKAASKAASDRHRTAREEYKKYCSNEIFIDLMGRIEGYFKDFSFNLTLQPDRARQTHLTKELPFAFKILDANGSERDFKEGLSEGEWQVLSLCFFFAFLDIQKDKGKKILVFDDPITSLDNSNLDRLVQLIVKSNSSFSQTLIFTHHRVFFKFLWKRFGKRCLVGNILKNKEKFGGSFICQNKAENFINKLRGFEEHLQNSSRSGIDIELKVVEYGQYLRYEIERFIKYGLLHWDASSNFGSAIDGLKKNKNISDDDLDKLKDIYSFCNWTTSHVDVGDDHGLSQLKTKIATFINVSDAHRSK